VSERKRRGWPAGARALTTRELRWRCAPRQVREAIEEERRRAQLEQTQLEEEYPDAAEREKVVARRRLTDGPLVDFDEVVGQDRAREAIRVGLSTEAPGFHVFVVGPPGLGRRALVKAALTRFVPPLPRPRDRVYVANFRHPERPRVLTLPRGKGRRFRRDVDETLAILRRAIPGALNQELHVSKTERLRRRYDQAATKLIEDLAAELRLEGLIVGPIPEAFGTPELRVDVDGEREPLPARVVERRLEQGDLRATPELEARLAAYWAAAERLDEVAGEARARSRQGTLAIRRLDARVARVVAQGFADDIRRAYPTEPVRRWLDSFLDEVGEKVELFMEIGRRDEEQGEGEADRRDLEALATFQANLFVDTKEHPVPPLVFEPNPTYSNLFGTLEPSEGVGADHMRLRAGSLFRANGGVIVVDAAELFQDRSAWRALKRAVRSGWLEVQATGSTTPGSSLRPEPIRGSFKLVAIGSEDLFEYMATYDPSFAQVFKVKVQLEGEIPRSDANVHAVAAALLRSARRSGLREPDGRALAQLVERSAWLAGRRERLTPRFSELIDILQEADRLATADRPRGRTIRQADVEAALEQRRRRHDLPERRVQDEIDEGAVLLDTAGARAGVINALVIYDTGDYVFGRPARVTAAVGLGRRGVVDVEREASFSGDTHHKGVQIVAGLLRERFGQDKPLCLTATVCFEQSYAMVDGDSASLAEVAAVLSALGDVPIDQRWALTGSLNQKGEVQAVGDVTAKVEGFFDVCRARDLKGRGVLIPASNAGDLMLRPEVVNAVRAGDFRVVAVSTLDAALEIMTGLPAGERPTALDPWPEGTLAARVDARLDAYAESARRFEERPEH